MKGGYAMTLMMILILTNVMLFIYGIDIPIADWMDSSSGNNTFGGQVVGTGTTTQPIGSMEGGLGSSDLIWKIIGVLVIAVTGGLVAGLVPALAGSNYSVNFTIPLAMFMALAIMMFTPMGTIIGTWTADESLYCYPMRDGVTMFNQANTGSVTLMACVPTEVHLLMAVFFGLMAIISFMSFVSGRDY